MAGIIRNVMGAKGLSVLVAVCLLFSAVPAVHAAVTIDNVAIKFSNTTATASGTISSGEGQFVGLEVVRPDKIVNETQPVQFSRDIVCYADQTISGAAGVFAFSFAMKATDPSGIYTFRINGIDGMNTVTMPYDYVNPGEIAESIGKINQAGSQDEIYNLLKNDTVVIRSFKIMEFSMDEYNGLTDTGKKRVCDVLVKGDKPYTAESLKTAFNRAVAMEVINQTTDTQKMGQLLIKYNDILSLDLGQSSTYANLSAYHANIHQILIDYGPYVDTAEQTAVVALQKAFGDAIVLTTVNTAVWGDMEGVFSQYNDKLCLNLSGDYAGLSRDNKILVQKALVGKGFKSITEVQTAFNNKVSELKETVVNPVHGGGTGGAGKSSSTISISSPVIAESAATPTPIPRTTFNDLADVSWAKASIEELASRGIINGLENNEFRPNENVTREQFIKMLMLAFNLSDNNAAADFKDVRKDAWYYTYVAGAQQFGIISGLGDGNFGIGKEISRQEMAAMAYRASQHAGVQLTLEQTSPNMVFADGDSIADYAVQSVKIMQQAGIINGVEGNRFAPDDAATRAQAAKIIYTLLQCSEKKQ